MQNVDFLQVGTITRLNDSGDHTPTWWSAKFFMGQRCKQRVVYDEVYTIK